MTGGRRATSARRRGGGSGARARVKEDRDGDLSMGIPAKSRSAIGKSSAKSAGPAGGRKRDLTSRATKGGILNSTAQRAILRQAAANGDVSMKEKRTPAHTLVEMKVTGWDKSKATATTADGGVSSLIKWLEKKASTRLGSGRREVKIKKSRQEGNVLFISVTEGDGLALTRINGFVWASANITITKVGETTTGTAPLSTEAEKIKVMLKGVLERRYNPDTKLLDLSALGQDEELRAQAIFDTTAAASKFFPAMMRVLELAFDTPAERDAAVQSVTLANNALQDLKIVSTLSATLPKLHNLDLSNNQFADLAALELWRRRFLELQHLVLTGNPLEQNDPSYAAEIVRRYPNLRMLNNTQVRTEEEIAQRSKHPPIPFPIRSPLFQDEGGIAENFVRTFFQGIDADRPALVSMYYDNHSEFSLALNTAAPRDPNASSKNEKQDWDYYIKHSRNLKKMAQISARQSRVYKGANAILETLNGMPRTKHPDLATEARKWMIEAHIQPGFPDPTGQSPNGVDGFCITVHTEFDELDASSGQPKKKRSVDHLFMIGPGGPTGVRVHLHQYTIRAYGGSQAFEPDEAPETNNVPSQQQAEAVPQLPAGLTIEMAEQMVAELTKQTGMTLQYSKDCLEQTTWNFPAALEAFAQVKATLPPTAFIQMA